jgi:hypothetical protein
MKVRLAIIGFCLAFCSGARSQSEQKTTADNHAEANAAALRFEYDRPSGVRCRDLQFLSSSGEPFAAVSISFAREYIKVDPQHPSKVIVNFGQVVRRFTDKVGHLQLPALEPGTYLIRMQGAEKQASGDAVVYRWTQPLTCSQVFIAEDNGSYMSLHAVR